MMILTFILLLNAGVCTARYYISTYPPGTVISGKLLLTTKKRSTIECGAQCDRTTGCLSYNFCKGEGKCQLSGGRIATDASSFTKGCRYYENKQIGNMYTMQDY